MWNSWTQHDGSQTFLGGQAEEMPPGRDVHVDVPSDPWPTLKVHLPRHVYQSALAPFIHRGIIESSPGLDTNLSTPPASQTRHRVLETARSPALSPDRWSARLISRRSIAEFLLL